MNGSESSGSLAIIGTVIAVIFLLFVVWEALHGLRRGLFRQLLHTGMMLVAAIISFAISMGIWNGFFGSFSGMTTEQALAEFETSGMAIPEELRAILACFDIETLEYLIALPFGALIIPGLFMISFVLINFLFKIVYFILRKVLGIEKGHGLVKRLGGLAIGAVEGALVASIIMLPFVAIGDLAGEAVALADDGSAEMNEAIEAIDPIANNTTFAFIKTIGGKAILNSFCTVKIDGEKINLRDDMMLAVKLIAVDGSKLSETDWKSLTAEDKAALEAMNTTAGDSEYISIVLSGMLSGMCRAVQNGTIPFELEAPFDSLLSSALEIFATSNKDNIETDIQTLLHVYFILSDNGVLTAMEAEGGDITSALAKKDENGETTINKLIAEINKNERSKPLVTSLTKLSLSILCDQLGVGGDSDIVYESVKGGINAKVMTIDKASYNGDDTAYKAALSSSLNDTFTENNINLDAEIVNDIADYIDEEYISKGVTEISDDEFNDIMLTYYDSYASRN